MKTKKDGRSINRDVQEHLRMQGIKLWKKNMKVKDISETLGVTIFAVYNWIKKYEKQGLKGLKKRKAKGAEPKLSKKEMKKLVELIEKTADNYGFESPLCDCKKITQLIKEKFGKTVHFSNVWRLLQRLGLSSEKTADNYGFESPLCDCKKITQLIKEKFGKTVHFSNVWRLLQRLGLSSQK